MHHIPDPTQHRLEQKLSTRFNITLSGLWAKMESRIVLTPSSRINQLVDRSDSWSTLKSNEKRPDINLHSICNFNDGRTVHNRSHLLRAYAFKWSRYHVIFKCNLPWRQVAGKRPSNLMTWLELEIDVLHCSQKTLWSCINIGFIQPHECLL